MTVEKINVSKSLEEAKRLLASEKNISPAFRSIVEVLITLISILVNRLNVNSSNSSLPPSQDPNRAKKSKAKASKTKRKPGGQKGRTGVTLEKVKNPDKIELLEIDRRTLPKGKYSPAGYESRQVFDIEIKRKITEYRAEILVNEHGAEYRAEFPEGVTKAIQYGPELKAQSVYMSQYQLVPLDRVVDYFKDQAGMPVSKGSIYNFNREAYERLSGFEEWAKSQLKQAPVNHADETTINLNGKKIWLHSLSNEKVTLYHADTRRGKKAMDRMGVLPDYQGILCHDHWKSYYRYKCIHSLCNAHHLRELERALDADKQRWAKSMKKYLEKLNQQVKEAGGVLSPKDQLQASKKYRAILKRGEKECPHQERKDGKKGRAKQTKSRNLLVRLRDYEADVLRFMTSKKVPFTNNRGENDLRMSKVQQKISGCFRSRKGADIFCRNRSFISSCRKYGIRPTPALRNLFQGKLPDFINLE